MSRARDQIAATPRLSVIVPAWNAAATIERALDSVLDERGVDLECVVVDDASTDATPELVQAVADRDPRVVLIRLSANGGVSNARNRGLAAAHGDWLAFHDADDVMLPGGLAALMVPAADPSVRAVIGQRVWTDGSRRWLGRWYDIPDIRRPGRKSIAANPGLLYYASATGKAFHRSLAEGLEFEGRLLGDQAWTIRALLRAGDGIEVIEMTVFEWWRPPSDGPATGITATSRASGRGAGDVAAMAAIVFDSVSAEIDDRIGDGPTRLAIKRAYFDRLVWADLSGQVRNMLARSDPDMDRFFEAVGRFLRAVPAEILVISDALKPAIVRPPAAEWRALSPTAREAYGRMLQPVTEADPSIRWQVRMYRLGAALRILGNRGGPLGRVFAATVHRLAVVGRGRAGGR